MTLFLVVLILATTPDAGTKCAPPPNPPRQHCYWECRDGQQVHVCPLGEN